MSSLSRAHTHTHTRCFHVINLKINKINAERLLVLILPIESENEARLQCDFVGDAPAVRCGHCDTVEETISFKFNFVYKTLFVCSRLGVVRWQLHTSYDTCIFSVLSAFRRWRAVVCFALQIRLTDWVTPLEFLCFLANAFLHRRSQECVRPIRETLWFWFEEQWHDRRGFLSNWWELLPMTWQNPAQTSLCLCSNAIPPSHRFQVTTINRRKTGCVSSDLLIQTANKRAQLLWIWFVDASFKWNGGKSVFVICWINLRSLRWMVGLAWSKRNGQRVKMKFILWFHEFWKQFR